MTEARGCRLWTSKKRTKVSLKLSTPFFFRAFLVHGIASVLSPAITVHVELAGLKPEDVHVTVKDGFLTLQGTSSHHDRRSMLRLVADSLPIANCEHTLIQVSDGRSEPKAAAANAWWNARTADLCVAFRCPMQWTLPQCKVRLESQRLV